MRQNYEDELYELYDSFYKGNCNYEHCSRNMCKTSQNIQFDYATKLGVNYGQDGVYKVLVVGKESTTVHTKIERPVDDIYNAPNPHYRGTLYTLALLLDETSPRSTAVEDLKEYSSLLTRFCLTNYFKCAFRREKGVRNVPVNQSMRDSCYKLLIREMEILKPDIVIIQGKFTSKTFWNVLEQNGSECICGANSPVSLYRYSLNGRTCYVLWGYHPASPWWNKRLPELRTAISAFKDCQR